MGDVGEVGEVVELPLPAVLPVSPLPLLPPPHAESDKLNTRGIHALFKHTAWLIIFIHSLYSVTVVTFFMERDGVKILTFVHC